MAIRAGTRCGGAAQSSFANRRDGQTTGRRLSATVTARPAAPSRGLRNERGAQTPPPYPFRRARSDPSRDRLWKRTSRP
jgi:hypothetical protein